MEENKKVNTTKPQSSMTMSKVKFWGLLALSFFIGAVLMSSASVDTSENRVADETAPTATPEISVTIEPSQSPTELPTQSPTELPTPTTAKLEENTEITHQELYEMSIGGSEVIGKQYKMGLYLEEPPTTTQASFMTLLDANSMENILIVCNMNASDLSKLDGESALQRNYPQYLVSLEFEEYDEGLIAYEASCELVD